MTWCMKALPLTTTVTVSGQAYDVAWGSHNTPSTMTPGATATVNLTFTNAGTFTWLAGGATPVHLSYHWRNGACSGTSTAVWNGRRGTFPSDVAPGGTVSNLALQLEAPSTAGTYCLVYDLVHEGVTWFSQQGADTLMTTVSITSGGGR